MRIHLVNDAVSFWGRKTYVFSNFSGASVWVTAPYTCSVMSFLQNTRLVQLILKVAFVKSIQNSRDKNNQYYLFLCCFLSIWLFTHLCFPSSLLCQWCYPLTIKVLVILELCKCSILHLAMMWSRCLQKSVRRHAQNNTFSDIASQLLTWWYALQIKLVVWIPSVCFVLG